MIKYNPLFRNGIVIQVHKKYIVIIPTHLLVGHTNENIFRYGHLVDLVPEKNFAIFHVQTMSDLGKMMLIDTNKTFELIDLTIFWQYSFTRYIYQTSDLTREIVSDFF